MVGDADARSVEPVVNPGLGDARRRRLIRMTKEQIAGRTGPLRQVRDRLGVTCLGAPDMTDHVAHRPMISRPSPTMTDSCH